MYYVYVLQSKKDSGLYIGYTKDLKKRILEHNRGECVSTKDRRPFSLVYYEGYASNHDAAIREKRIKQFKNAYTQLIKRINNSIEK